MIGKLKLTKTEDVMYNVLFRAIRNAGWAWFGMALAYERYWMAALMAIIAIVADLAVKD